MAIGKEKDIISYVLSLVFLGYNDVFLYKTETLRKHKMACDNDNAKNEPINPHRYVKLAPNINSTAPDIILFIPTFLYNLKPPKIPFNVFDSERRITITPK